MAGRTTKKTTPTLKNVSSSLVSNILNTPLQTLINRLMYLVLLLAFLVIGYLYGKVENVKIAQSPTAVVPAPNAAPGTAQPTPVVMNPADVLKKITAGSFPTRGNQNAKVTIVEFADFRCPFCEKFFSETEPQLTKDYIDTGKVKFIFRNYAFLGPASTVAANASECANEQGKFWEYYDWLYKNQPSESDVSMYVTDKLSQAAGTLGMDASQFASCLDSKKYDNNVSKDFSEGQSIGVSATPTFFVNGVQLLGALPYATFKATIDQELAK